ncbi:hypothetical protein EV384_4538 [Micromonospora kangleipakensis]|uniref:Uncharacterized protein n=1 Tax=Micromonospora kangleipakensis TaxID=1077942 RepID=A0A4Q8BE56_9ACTN|nr:hypothetical protein [Micromonospora kangleipakensis]RZU75958.1 hypothetical protein EV384_4538 [Micromonospora kangleipakensis]
MSTPFADDRTDPDDQPPPDTAIQDDEPYVRLPIDPAEPMASWLAII